MSWPSGRRWPVDEAVSQVIHHTYEMWITREEFLRCLPAAVANAPFTITSSGAVSIGTEAKWRFAITELPERVLTPLVRCPRLHVALTLDGYSPEAANAFILRFLRYFQRGGG